jgi:hypothetical protein
MPELAGPVWELGIPKLGQPVLEGVGAAAPVGPFILFPKK